MSALSINKRAEEAVAYDSVREFLILSMIECWVSILGKGKAGFSLVFS